MRVTRRWNLSESYGAKGVSWRSKMWCFEMKSERSPRSFVWLTGCAEGVFDLINLA